MCRVTLRHSLSAFHLSHVWGSTQHSCHYLIRHDFSQQGTGGSDYTPMNDSLSLSNLRNHGGKGLKQEKVIFLPLVN